MTSPSIKSRTTSLPLCGGVQREPVGNSVAVSVKSQLKTKSTITKPSKAPCPPKTDHKKLLGKVKHLIHKKPTQEPCEWPSSEVLLCTILAWIGGLVIAAVVFRSLYLMYCKPEEF